jgi:hypothetical protein
VTGGIAMLDKFGVAVVVELTEITVRSVFGS